MSERDRLLQALDIAARYVRLQKAPWSPVVQKDDLKLVEAELSKPNASEQGAASEPKVTQEMIDRFLSWKLPDDFCPDAGITFKRTYNEASPFGPSTHEPIGTNLLTAEQARAMLEHVLAAPVQAAPAEPVRQWIADVIEQVLYPLAHENTELGRIAEGFGMTGRAMERILATPERSVDADISDDSDGEAVDAELARSFPAVHARMMRKRAEREAAPATGRADGKHWLDGFAGVSVATPAPVAAPALVPPRPLPESMSRDEMLKYYSAHANLLSHEALRYQKRIRELEAILAASGEQAPHGKEVAGEQEKATEGAAHWKHVANQLDRVADCCAQGLSEPEDAVWIRKAAEALRASPAPAEPVGPEIKAAIQSSLDDLWKLHGNGFGTPYERPIANLQTALDGATE